MNTLLESISEQVLTIFLWCTGKCHTSEEEQSDYFYPQYLFYEYGITNPHDLYCVLFSLGYYELASLDDILFSSNSTELKVLLKDNGLKVSGSKAELINRIKNCIPQSVLNDFRIGSGFYSLSITGKSFVDEHYDYVLLHKYSKWNISLEELNQAKSTLGWQSVSFRDAAWSIFNKRMLQHSMRKDFVNFHMDITGLSEISFDFDKDMKNGVYFLLIALYLDINCLIYHMDYLLYLRHDIPKCDLASLHHSHFITEYSVEKIRKYRDYIDLNMVKDAYCFVPTYPLKLYSQQDFSDMVLEIIQNDTFDIDKWCDFSQKRFEAFIKSLD